MKTRLFLSTLIASGLFTVAHAMDATPEVTGKPGVFSAPAPAMVVSPSELPHCYRNRVVRLRMMIDENGRPSGIALARGRDPQLARRLIPAVAQWRFKPAMSNGVPVPARIVLPVRLVEADGF